jgi:hypothetical protein
MFAPWPLFFAATTSAAAAAVPVGQQPTANELEAPHKLRSGVAVGITLGVGPVGASGYPNDLNKIGDPNFYSSSDWMIGNSESVFLMGALTDYLNFGFWYTHESAESREWRSVGNGGGLRVELFPLVGLVGLVSRFSGLGLLAQFGVGSGFLSSKVDPPSRAEGTQSFITAGALYEWSFGHVLGGHLGAGPTLEYHTIWSQPFDRQGLLASARVVFYGGP